MSTYRPEPLRSRRNFGAAHFIIMMIRQSIQEAMETQRQAEQAMFEVLLSGGSPHAPLVAFTWDRNKTDMSNLWYLDERLEHKLTETEKTTITKAAHGTPGTFTVEFYQGWPVPQYDDPLVPYPTM